MKRNSTGNMYKVIVTKIIVETFFSRPQFTVITSLCEHSHKHRASFCVSARKHNGGKNATCSPVHCLSRRGTLNHSYLRSCAYCVGDCIVSPIDVVLSVRDGRKFISSREIFRDIPLRLVRISILPWRASLYL